MKSLMIATLLISLIGCNVGMNENMQENQVKVKEHTKQRQKISQEIQYSQQKTKNNAYIERKILNVPHIKQNPELKYGCEVTSLTMVLQYAGVKVDKMQLAKELPKENNKIIKDKSGNIVKWGDPDKGFVGDITGRKTGYAVFDKPIEELMRDYLGERTVNLTGRPFDELLEQIKNDRPVIVWSTTDYRVPRRFETWENGDKLIRLPLTLHAVVLVGYDENHVYINDPLVKRKSIKINKQRFIATWRALNKRAISYY